MPDLSYAIFGTQGGEPQTGLNPVFTLFKALVSPWGDKTPPAIQEIGEGWYGYTYDSDTNGESLGTIDMGASIDAPSERFLPVVVDKLSPKVIHGNLVLGALGMDGITLTDPADHTHRTDTIITALMAVYDSIFAQVSTTQVSTGVPGSEVIHNQAGTVIATIPYEDDGTTFLRHGAD